MKNTTFQFGRLIAVVVLPMYLAACTSWQAQEVAPSQFVEQEQPEKIRVMLTDSTTVDLENPLVFGDTLSGVRDGLQMSISLSTVDAIAVRKEDTAKTLGVTVLGVFVFGVAGVLLVLGLIACVQCGG